MNKSMMYVYLRSLIGKFHKIKPMKSTGDPTLRVYLDSFICELEGNADAFPELSSDSRYVTALDIAHYLRREDVPMDVVHREVEKAIDLIKKIICDAR